MRLIHIDSLELKEFVTDIPRYAILSHRWSGDEIQLKEYRKLLRLERNQRVGSLGYKKVEQFCEFIRTLWRDGSMLRQDSLKTTEVKSPRPLEWVWVDTVCIDKHSSAELSEAINSMYEWYYNAALCVAYLADVPRRDPRLQPLLKLTWMSDYLKGNQWFGRGWTLQELLAPQIVSFVNSEWEMFGRKDDTLALRSSDIFQQDFLDIIAQITHIPRVYIGLRDAISRACFAEKMSWASRRETSRPEDMAYCLLGLLNVNIPLLYGEGAQKAFLRVQQQFIQQSDDESIFAWNDVSGALGSPWGILASSPLNFRDSGQIRAITTADKMYTFRPPYTITNKGLSFETVAYSLHRDDNTDVPEQHDQGIPRIIIDRELPPGPVYAVPLNCRITLSTAQRHGRALCFLKGSGRLMAPREQNSRIAYAGDTCWIFLREHEAGMAVGETSDYFDDPDSSLVLGFRGERDQTPKRLFVKLQSAARRTAKADPTEQGLSSRGFENEVQRVKEKLRRFEAHETRFEVIPRDQHSL